jgi:hypothetical protein
MMRGIGAVAALLAVLTLSQRTEGVQAQARISVEAPGWISLGEPVELFVAIQNQSQTPFQIDLGRRLLGNWEFSHTPPNAPTRSGIRIRPQLGGMQLMSEYEIPQKHTETLSLVLDQWFSLSTLGRHRVELRFIGSLKSKTTQQPIEINRASSFSVDVRAHDPRRLRERCASWLRAAAEPTTRDHALTALQYVADPVAIPFLVQAITDHEWFPAFDTLAKIGGADVIVELERLRSSKNSNIRSTAEQTLARIRRKSYTVLAYVTQDMELIDRIPEGAKMVKVAVQ